jgi:uncharacterized membrane protein
MKPEEQLQAQIQTAPAHRETVRDQDKIMLVFAYLGPLALIPLLTVKDSEFVKWHAKNGLTLDVLGFLAWIILPLLPLAGLFLACVSLLGLIGITVMAISKALRGERWRIPGVSDLADKF